EIEATLSPFPESRIRSVALGSDSDEARHGTAAHFHRADMRLAECLPVGRFPDADQQASFAADRAAHATLHHETQPAHQLLLDDVAPVRKNLAHALSRGFVVGHWRYQGSAATISMS